MITHCSSLHKLPLYVSSPTISVWIDTKIWRITQHLSSGMCKLIAVTTLYKGSIYVDDITESREVDGEYGSLI